jgi:hypothetical protein
MPEQKFKKEIESLVRYVKNQMKDEDDWVVIKYRDVPKIANISSYYVRKLFELLKGHKNIVFRIDEEAKTHKKPLLFRYVSEEEKVESTLSENHFYYLTEEEVAYIKEKTGIREYQYLYRVLNVSNYLASVGAKESLIPIDIKAISDTLVVSKKEVESTISTLKESQMLIDIDGAGRLVLNAEDLQNVSSTIPQSAQKLDDNLHLDTHKLIDKLLEKQGMSESVADGQDDELRESNSLIENMRNFRNTISAMQDDFKTFLDKEIEKVSESEKKDKKMDEGFETLQKLMEDNKRLSEENKDLTRENERIVRSLQAAQKFRDQFIENAEQRLEILLAETIGIVSNYAQIPGWQKDQAANAKLQKNILNAVTSAVDDMLKFNKD